MMPRTELTNLVRAVIRETDNAFKGVKTNYSNVIDITYYRDKKNAVEGKYDFRTGILTVGGDSFIWDKQKVIH